MAPTSFEIRRWCVYEAVVHGGPHPIVVVDIIGDFFLVVHGRTQAEPYDNQIAICGGMTGRYMNLPGPTHFWKQASHVHLLARDTIVRSKNGHVPNNLRIEFEALANEHRPALLAAREK